MKKSQWKRYLAAMHRIQSVIAYRIGAGDALATPKHLRVGVDGSKADQEGLVRLLIKKGVISREEYEEAIVGAAEREADRQVETCRKDHSLPDTVRFA